MTEKKAPPSRRKRDELLDDLRAAEARINALEQEKSELEDWAAANEGTPDHLVNFSTRIPLSVRERLDETAKANHTSVQTVTIAALRRSLWEFDRDGNFVAGLNARLMTLTDAELHYRPDRF